MTPAAPTRTHNNDTANSTASTRSLWSRNKGDVVEMGIANASAIYAMLSDLSATPGNYVIREAYSNAYDATLRAHSMDRPIEIHLPAQRREIVADGIAAKLMGDTDTVTANLVVCDHGCGMSYDEVCSYFLQYGGSDKVDELDSVGSKGLGAKAPLAIADSFDVTTTKDGITTHAHITRQPKRAGQATVYTERTGAENGTTVTIPIASDSLIDQMWQFVHSLERFSTDANVSVNGHLIEAKLPSKMGENSDSYICLGEVEIPCDPPTRMRAWQHYSPTYHMGSFPHVCYGPNDHASVSALVGGVIYPLSRERPHAGYIVEVDPGWLDFTPSRDEVKQCDATTAFEKTVKLGLSQIDIAAVLEAHIATADALALARVRAQSEIETPSTQTSAKGRPYMTPHYPFTFIEDIARKHYVKIGRDKTFEISDATFQTVCDTTCDVDVIVLTHVGTTQKAKMAVNGTTVPRTEAKKLIGHHDQRALMGAISNEKVTPNVISGVMSDDDAAWVIRNEANMRSVGLIDWRADRASIVMVDDLANIDASIRELLLTFNNVSLDTAKARVSAEMAKRRQERKQNAQAAAATQAATQIWARHLVSLVELPRGASEEELMLWMLHPKSSSLPTPQDTWLDKLGASADEIAIAIVDALPSYMPSTHNLASLLAIAMLKDPTCVPDRVRYVVATDTKHLQAKEFTALVEQGAFLIADRRTKLKSLRDDGLADRRPDLITVSHDMHVVADCSGVADHEMLARVLEFGRTVGADAVERCDTKMAALASLGVDPSLLTGDARLAIANVASVFRQYHTIKGTNRFLPHTNIVPLTLCGHDLTEDELGRNYYRSQTGKAMKNVPDDVRQALLDCAQTAQWLTGLVTTFGVTPAGSGPSLGQADISRLQAFAPALSADMDAHFERKVV